MNRNHDNDKYKYLPGAVHVLNKMNKMCTRARHQQHTFCINQSSSSSVTKSDI